jgi:hypothetical protein
MPLAHLKKKSKKKNKKQGGRPPLMGWFGHPSIYLYIFLVFFLEKKSVGGHFGNK